jgi:hypothetical protein
MKKKVKCIDIGGCILTLGKEYVVTDEHIKSSSYHIVCDDGIGYWMCSSQFADVIPHSASAMATGTPAVKRQAKMHDQNEECPCKIGISRAQCQYHKDT